MDVSSLKGGQGKFSEPTLLVVVYSMLMSYYISNYSYIFLSNYNIMSQKKKCAIFAAYLDKTRFETKVYEKNVEAGRQR